MADHDDTLTAQAARRLGDTLKGKWRLDNVLGVGGMAVVYSATHRNGKRVAVKMLHPALAASEEVRARFLREGYVANAVGHEGAVSVLDDDEITADGSVFLVMELLDGETLDALWSRRGSRLPVTEALGIAVGVLDVLAAAHDQGIVHRDIKPENLFVTRTGAVKVLDFGIARLREMSVRTSATQGGVTMGTPAFMPPEQARGRWDDVDARTDVWAVGATLFVLLTGRNVHTADTTNELLLAAMTKPAPPIGSILPELDERVAGIVDKALSFERLERWTDARAMQSALLATGAPAPRAQSTPRASVPDEAAAITLPRSGALTTARAIERGAAEGAPRRSVALNATAAVSTLFAIGILVALARMRDGNPPVAAAAAPVGFARDSIVAVAPPPPVALPSPSVSQSPPPQVSAAPLAPPPPRAIVSPPHSPAAAPSARVQPGCDPPFEFDAKGVKRWKLGCL
jgi:hypothetical protein